jgi:uncharacterized protein with HEPN domain
MGNILRHVYHRVDDEIVWNTVKEELRRCGQQQFRRLSGRCREKSRTDRAFE